MGAPNLTLHKINKKKSSSETEEEGSEHFFDVGVMLGRARDCYSHHVIVVGFSDQGGGVLTNQIQSEVESGVDGYEVQSGSHG